MAQTCSRQVLLHLLRIHILQNCSKSVITQQFGMEATLLKHSEMQVKFTQ